MALSETLISAVAVAGFILVVYSNMKKQTIADTIREIKEIFQDKSETVMEGVTSGGALKYAN